MPFRNLVFAGIAACAPSATTSPPNIASPAAPARVDRPGDAERSTEGAAPSIALHPEETPPDPATELAWLQQRGPELASLRTGAPALPSLLAWAPPSGSLELWLIAGPYRCTPTLAERRGDNELELSIVVADRRVKGRRVRTLRNGAAGQLLTYTEGTRRERQAAEGSWVAEPDATATSGGAIAGALRAVEGDVAHFDGQPVRLDVTCPVVQLDCAIGGTRACRDCSLLAVRARLLTDLHAGLGTISPRGATSTCLEPCPPETSPDKERAERIIRSLDTPWTVGVVSATGLYRSRTACTTALTQAR